MPLLMSLRVLLAAGLLFSKTGTNTLRDVLPTLVSAVTSNDFDLDRVKPLLRAALASEPRDSLIWNCVSAAAVESTPRPSTPPTLIKAWFTCPDITTMRLFASMMLMTTYKTMSGRG